MRKLNLFISIMFLSLFFALPSKAALVGNTTQATLSLSPQSGTYNANNSIPVSVYLNTNGQDVVVVAAYLNYDKTHFQAVSIDTTSSVFTIEAEKVIDSVNGVIKITRGNISSSHVNSSNALVAVINLKAISGTAPSSDNLTFQFLAGSTIESNVIKDDGLGTDILSGVYNAMYAITGAGDITAPTIFSVAASSITSSGATITWTTNEVSDSQIEYGTTVFYGGQTTLNSSMVTSHSQSLSGLSLSTIYHYRVKSKDAANNLATSADYTFTTVATSSSCTSFTYSSWGACQSNNIQLRTVASSLPAGCTGGNPILSQSCIYSGGGSDGGGNALTIDSGQTSSIGTVGSSGTNLFMYLNSQANFTAVVSGGKTENYNLKINQLEIEKKQIWLGFNSQPITFKLTVGQTKMIDLDGDGALDLKVIFNQLVVNKIDLTIKTTKPKINGSGDLVKLDCATCKTVYYIGNDGKRYVFPNDKVFKSWYSDFSQVKIIASEELNQYPIGGNVTYRPGIKMVKIQTDPKVYAVEKSGGLRWIKTEGLAQELYGANWNKMIDDIPILFFINYKIGAELSSIADYDKNSATMDSVDINIDKDLF